MKKVNAKQRYMTKLGLESCIVILAQVKFFVHYNEMLGYKSWVVGAFFLPVRLTKGGRGGFVPYGWGA